jgi:hypothetical protein
MDFERAGWNTRRVLQGGIFVAVCLAPLGFRLAHPSIYSDDVTRIGLLEAAAAPWAVLFQPFNEHMAPLFQIVSIVTWECAGRSLVNAPLAFTLASFVPHVLSLILLFLLIRRELQSMTAALIGVAAFGLSGVISETFNWYSASSFSWAMLGTLAAVDAAGRATTTRGKARAGWLAASLLASLLAPTGSGIGLLAGPLAAVRLITGTGTSVAMRVAGFVPPIGTALYFAVCSLFRYRDVLSESLGKNVSLARTLRNVGCVTPDILLPGLLGLRSAEQHLPDYIGVAISVVGLVATLAWAKRNVVHRSLILVGLGLIVGGYVLTFGMRSYPGSPVVLSIQRYQLFPHLGLVLLLCIATRRWLVRCDASLRRSLTLATLAAVAIFLLQLRSIREHARFYRWPEQRKTLTAIAHLAEICEHEGITRDQCITVMEPLRTQWFNNDFNGLIALPPCGSVRRCDDSAVRPTLLAALNRSEREALCGGMNVARHLTFPGTVSAGDPVAIGRLVGNFDVRPTAAPDRWYANGWASYLEFELSATRAQAPAGARVLALPVDGPVELWWSDGDGKWSELRSVRWWPPRTVGAMDWAAPLEKLPHWDTATIRRVRITPRRPGMLTAGAPRLLR